MPLRCRPLVWCPCGQCADFRLIVVAEDTEVHNTFPIPLINRLEFSCLHM